jgi:cell division septum initiation protein DivIVA
MTRSSEEIEREVEQQRRQVEEKLTQLKDRMSLGQIVEQASHYVHGDDVRRAAGNFGRQVRDNPVALTLVVAGVGWMMLGSGSSSGSSHYGNSPGYGGRQSAEGKASTMTSKIKSTAGSAGDTLHSAMESGRRGLHDVRDGIAKVGRSVRKTASGGSKRMSSGTSSVTTMMERDPLLVGGLALMAGVAIGMMLPATRTENRYMGKMRDDLMEGARDQASRMTEKAVHVAEDAARSAKDAVVDTLKSGSSSEETSAGAGGSGTSQDTSYEPAGGLRSSNL